MCERTTAILATANITDINGSFEKCLKESSLWFFLFEAHEVLFRAH